MVSIAKANCRRGSSPRRELVRRAVWFAVLYGAAHILGLRQCVSALLEGSKSGLLERIGCATYLFLYGSFVVLVPTLMIAALLLLLWDGLCGRARRR